MNTIQQLLVGAAVAASLASTHALAQPSGSGGHGAHQAQAPAAATADMADGEVRKVDKSAAKITVRHGEIKSLDMPAMTMVFGVKDAAMLDQVKAGDRIRFQASNEGGKYTLTQIQPSR